MADQMTKDLQAGRGLRLVDPRRESIPGQVAQLGEGQQLMARAIGQLREGVTANSRAAVAGVQQSSQALQILNLMSKFFAEHLFPSLPNGAELDAEWRWMQAAHNVEATRRNVLGSCERVTVATWGEGGARIEVAAFIAEGVDAAMAFVLVDDESPLADQFDGATRKDADKGAVLRKLSAQVSVARQRLVKAGAYEGNPHWPGGDGRIDGDGQPHNGHASAAGGPRIIVPGR